MVGVVYAVSPCAPSALARDTDQCQVQCSGPILQTVQFAGLFNDSKTFVDMPLLYDPDDVIQYFDEMADYSPRSIAEFVRQNFAPRCSDMLVWSPPDYSEHPAFTGLIHDDSFREWGMDVHALWNLLGRRMDPDVALHPTRHTLLPLRSPHIIVPGGRFCEFYCASPSPLSSRPCSPPNARFSDDKRHSHAAPFRPRASFFIHASRAFPLLDPLQLARFRTRSTSTFADMYLPLLFASVFFFLSSQYSVCLFALLVGLRCCNCKACDVS